MGLRDTYLVVVVASIVVASLAGVFLLICALLLLTLGLPFLSLWIDHVCHWSIFKLLEDTSIGAVVGHVGMMKEHFGWVCPILPQPFHNVPSPS